MEESNIDESKDSKSISDSSVNTEDLKERLADFLTETDDTEENSEPLSHDDISSIFK